MPMAYPNRDRADAILAHLNAMACPTGVVNLLGPINQQSASDARRAIERATRYADAISLRINSPSGDVECANAIADDLRRCGMDVTVHVGERCDSGSVVPLIAARHRIGPPFSSIFLHCAGLPAHALDDVADSVELRAWATRLERIDNQHRALLSTTGLPDWLLRQATSRAGLRLNASEAVAYGLIDCIEHDRGTARHHHAGRDRGSGWYGARSCGTLP